MTGRGILAMLGAAALATAPPLAAQGADSLLARPVSLSVRQLPLADALLRLRHNYALPLAWSGEVLPPDRRVTLALRNAPLGAALEALLGPAGLGVAITRDGTLVVVPAASAAASASAGAGAAPPPEPRFATGVRRLDQIVVIGSAVEGVPGREQATAVGVAEPGRLLEAAHTRMADLMRTLLPGVVLWDRGPGGPPATVAAVRGVSSFTSRGLKTYVDDVEVASPDLFTLIDGRSVERLEVLRGPQGAALYGPDALSGILQIVTRKGRLAAAPAAEATAAGGPWQRDGVSGTALWQDLAGSFEGGGSRASAEVDASYTRSGERRGVPWLSSWTGHAGGRAVAGPLLVTGSLRGGRYEYGAEPPGSGAGSSIPQALEERGGGITLRHAVTGRWRQSLMAGSHWISGAREPGRSVLTPRLPLGATHETASRTSLRYASMLELPLGAGELSLSGGAEHSRRSVERLELRSAAAGDLRVLYDDRLSSTGGFGQARLRLGERLVLSGGARAEWLSSVGARAGAAWAGTVGLSWSRPVGAAELRLRAAWGRGLRPPEPGMTRGMASATRLQVPNPELAPERQHGVEAGVEFHAGERLYGSVTGYDQRAGDLIQQVAVKDGGATVRAYQFQNVGAIANRGVELEAGWQGGGFSAVGALYLTRSEVVKVAPRYTGEFQPGDPVPEVPASVGTLRLGWSGGAVRVEAGGTWTGAWTGYDWAAAAAPGAAAAADRSYWIRYPGALRPWLAGAVELGRRVRVFGRVDNPFKAAIEVRDNLSPVVGRVAVLGVGVGG